MLLFGGPTKDLRDEEGPMLDLVVVQEDALIELRRLPPLALYVLRSTTVLPGHRDLLLGRDGETRLPSRTEVSTERDLPVPRTVCRRRQRPLRRLDPSADEDDVLRLEVESADVPRELVPASMVQEDVLREVAAGMEDLAVRVVLEDEDRALLVRELETDVSEGTEGPRARFPITLRRHVSSGQQLTIEGDAVGAYNDASALTAVTLLLQIGPASRACGR